VKCLTTCAESSIKQTANAKSDHKLLGRILDVDLAAKEAQYHECCRIAHVRKKN
jgi:hypothetical protein